MASRGWNGSGRALSVAFVLAALLWSAAASADPLDRWAAEIARASARFGVPEPWIRRVMRAESNGQSFLGGRPTVSGAGAMGLMQLMPGTWSDMQALLGLGPNPHDPADNIAAGTFYLRLMYERFGYPGLFAAYNAGPARYSAFLATKRGLPAETRAYVARVAGPNRAPPRAPEQAMVPAVAPSSSGKAGAPGARSLRPRSGDLFVALESTAAL